jgi:hypothetical protein
VPLNHVRILVVEPESFLKEHRMRVGKPRTVIEHIAGKTMAEPYSSVDRSFWSLSARNQYPIAIERRIAKKRCAASGC